MSNREDYRKSLGLPKRHEVSYDGRCEELASHFLEDEGTLYNKENLKRLAQAIQQAIEDEIESLRSEREANGQFGVGA